MGFSAVIAAVGLATSAYGVTKQQSAQKEQARAQQEGIAAQQRAENSRRQAMELDAMRRRREIVRQGIKARSMALSTATAQGAAGGSGLQGGLAGIEGQTNTNLLGVNQNQAIGADIFSANQEKFGADSRGVAAASRAATYGAISTLGQSILKNTGTIDRVGSSLFSRVKDANAVSIFNNGTSSQRAIY